MNAISMLMVQNPKQARAAEPSPRPKEPSSELSPGAAAFALLFQQVVAGANPTTAETAGEGGASQAPAADPVGGGRVQTATLSVPGADLPAAPQGAGEAGAGQTVPVQAEGLGAAVGSEGAREGLSGTQLTAAQPAAQASAQADGGAVAAESASSMDSRLQAESAGQRAAQTGTNPGGAAGAEATAGSLAGQDRTLKADAPAAVQKGAGPAGAQTESGQTESGQTEFGQTPGLGKAAVHGPAVFQSGSEAAVRAPAEAAETAGRAAGPGGTQEAGLAVEAAQPAALRPGAETDRATTGQSEAAPNPGSPNPRAEVSPGAASAGQGETGAGLDGQAERKHGTGRSEGRSDLPGASFGDAAAQALTQADQAGRPNPAVASTPGTPDPSPVTDRPDPRDVLGQVLGKLKVSVGTERSEARIHLVPAELGPVDLKVTLEGGQLTARFHVASGQVKEILEQHLPELKQALQNQGLRVEQFAVSFGSATTQQFAGQEQQAQAWQTRAAQRGSRSYGGAGGGSQEQLAPQRLTQPTSRRLDLIA